MTDRLYYREAERRSFDATVVACGREADGRWHVRLDRSAFYPASGGQPHDVGVVAGIPVVDVVDQDADVVHVLGEAVEVGAVVRGEIDWARRFDHMQQHTGQHVLSALFEQTCGARTVSFHLGREASTIDVEPEVTLAQIERAECEANEVVWANREVGVRFVEAAEATTLPLRKETARTGVLRLVEIPGVDLSACGGTHVARTGAIGAIVITAWERFKGGTRVSFVCGGRALAWQRAERDTVTAVRGVLGVGSADVVSAVERLRNQVCHLERTVADLGDRLVVYRAADWRAEAVALGGRQVVLRADVTLDVSGAKAIAQAVVAGVGGLVVVTVGGGAPAPVVAARSSDVAFDAAAFIKALTANLGGRGGGRSEAAQAGVPADPATILATARRILDDAF